MIIRSNAFKQNETIPNNKMVLLESNKYESVQNALQQVTFNNLFARSVIEHKITGKVFVDDPNNPQTFYIVHPYGMTLLLGDNSNKDFNEVFKKYALNVDAKRKGFEWMQAFPNSWDTVLAELFKEQLRKSEDNKDNQEIGMIELNTRVNFKFNKEKYLSLPKPKAGNDIQIVETDAHLFSKIKGGVVPSFFWNNEEDFFHYGHAYSLLYKNQLAATAFSSFRFDHLFELGIETEPEYRGKGFAEMVCSALIDFCINNNYEPIWACRKENTASYKLALKLGFEVSAIIPYYRLSK